MPILYRLENLESNQGLWYTTDGVFNPFIMKLTAAKSRDLPMGFDPMYSEGGAWISACDSIPDMRNWFSRRDLDELGAAGYHLYEHDVHEYRQVPGHAIFLRERVIASRQIDVSILYADAER